MLKRINKLQESCDSFCNFDFLGPLAFRLYLVTICSMRAQKNRLLLIAPLLGLATPTTA